MALHPLKDWENFVGDVCYILKRTNLEDFFHHTNNLKIKTIKFGNDKESNGELAFLDLLLKDCNGKISVLVYRKPTHIGQYLHYSHCTKNFTLRWLLKMIQV